MSADTKSLLELDLALAGVEVFMFWHREPKRSYLGVGLVIIILGCLFLVLGGIGWLVNTSAGSNKFVFPSMKIIGGVVTIALGYIIVQLESIRQK